MFIRRMKLIKIKKVYLYNNNINVYDSITKENHEYLIRMPIMIHSNIHISLKYVGTSRFYASNDGSLETTCNFKAINEQLQVNLVSAL